jgi:hypothetical protein
MVRWKGVRRGVCPRQSRSAGRRMRRIDPILRAARPGPCRVTGTPRRHPGAPGRRLSQTPSASSAPGFVAKREGVTTRKKARSPEAEKVHTKRKRIRNQVDKCRETRKRSGAESTNAVIEECLDPRRVRQGSGPGDPDRGGPDRPVPDPRGRPGRSRAGPIGTAAGQRVRDGLDWIGSLSDLAGRPIVISTVPIRHTMAETRRPLEGSNEPRMMGHDC